VVATVNDLTVTITEDHVVYLTGYDAEGAPVLVQRLEPEHLTVEDYRRVKPKRWWNL
jgi:hypothetical protein